jgi:DNA-binding transcriptional MerR regulator
LTPARDEYNGYKHFVNKDVGRLRFIREAKDPGYTLNEIRQILSDAQRGRSPCLQVHRIIHRRVAENRSKIEEALRLRGRMELALSQWQQMTDGLPDGDTVCYLLESFTDIPVAPEFLASMSPVFGRLTALEILGI